MEQDIEEYQGENRWEKAVNEEQYIKNWCKQSSENILFLLGEPGHGKSSFCMKRVSDFRDKKFFSDRIKKVFSFSLNPTAWIKEPKDSLDVKNIFILPNKQIMVNGKYQDIILGEEYLEESLIFLDGYDELYLRLQESSNTNSFLKELEKLAKDWNIKFIITSRKTCINSSDLHKQGYKICQLAKLTEGKQKDWINNVYNKELFPENPYDTKRIYNSFLSSKFLELLEIPILLQLIVSKYFYREARNITKLYDKLFEEILNTREEMTIGNFDENRTEEFKQIFELYAYNIYQNNDTYAIIESEELEEEENTKWKAVLLFYIKNIKNNQQNEYYIEFVHRSFYQYFQAWYFYNLIFEIVKENEEDKVANLFKSICWRKIEIDVIDMIGQINQNQELIQEQEQIKYILDIFEKTDGIIKGKEGEYCIPIGQVNILDRVENIIYNLLMILNIVLVDGLTLLKDSRIEQLMKKFDMSKIYLPQINMSGLNLNKVNFEEANLRRANLENIYLKEAHLKGANLEGANLRRAHLEETHLKEADLEGADLERAELVWTNLKSADLEWANLERAILAWANLKNADLTGANLRRANLVMANLKNTNLTITILEEAVLVQTIFDSGILKNAILEDTKISKVKKKELVALGIDVKKIMWCD